MSIKIKLQHVSQSTSHTAANTASCSHGNAVNSFSSVHIALPELNWTSDLVQFSKCDVNVTLWVSLKSRSSETICESIMCVILPASGWIAAFIIALLSLYPPSERSELARYHVILFSFRPSDRPSVHTQYLDANISKTVWDRDLVTMGHL